MNRLPVVLALAGALFTTACGDQPTSPRPGKGPSALISDATHGGVNKNVFFLPPLVPNPVGSSFYKAAEFNPNLTSAVIRVCRWGASGCEEVVASFGAGQATGPIQISTDHYLALWHTDESNLVADQPYRIEVFPDGDVSGDPVAWADVAVVNTGKELKNIDTDQMIGLIDGRTLPIKVRFQNGVRCASGNCISRRVTNTGGTLILATGNGALFFPAGWLPAGISEVTVTLQRHPPGPNNECVGREAYTGPGLVAQREACLEVTTDPVLVPGPTTGIQRPVFIYVCSESGEEDFLHEFLQIIKADDGRPLQALKDVDDDALIAQGFVPSCEGTPSDIGLGSHPLLRLASRGVRAVTRPLARLLEVKPLYAIDLGQGGEISLFDGFSSFTLGVMAHAAAFGEVPESASIGNLVPLSVQVTGLTGHAHAGDPEPDVVSEGLAGIDVTFTITAGTGSLFDPDDEGGGETELTVQTNADGVATVDLEVGSGTNTVSAVAVVDADAVTVVPLTLPVSFTVTGTEGGSIAGTVRNAAGAPIDGALVRLVSTSDETFEPQSTTTDDGEYSFTDLPAGSYFVSAAAIGFEITREFVPLDEGQDDITDLVLWPLGSVILSYSDPTLPEDDQVSTAGDVTSVQLVFNLVDGTYQATWNADPARPFNGNLRLNLNLGNTRLGGEPLQLPGIFENVNSQTQLSYTGTAAALTTWLVGDIIASAGTTPQFAREFNSGLVDSDDIALSNRDILQQTLAEIIPRQQ